MGILYASNTIRIYKKLTWRKYVLTVRTEVIDFKRCFHFYMHLQQTFQSH